MRVPRELIWVVILVAVLAIALLGCAEFSKTEEQRAEEYIAGREVYYAKHFVEIEYEGHLYIYYSRNERMGLTHAAHCKARHR